MTTSPQFGLFPAPGDDRLLALTAAQLAAGGPLELGQGVGAEVGQRAALEPGPKRFRGVEGRRLTRTKCHLHLNGARGAVEVLAHDAASVLGRTVPDDRQRSLELRAPARASLRPSFPSTDPPTNLMIG